MGTKSILSIVLIAILLINVVSFDSVFADDKDKEKKVKTLESECAKKLDKKKLNLDGLFCEAIFNLQLLTGDFNADSFFDIFISIDTPTCDEGQIAKRSLQSETGWICENDDDTQYSGQDFTLSSQTCPQGQFVSGIDSSGTIICTILPENPTLDCSALNQCSANGQCVEDNICQCDAGFSGDDCSVPDNQCNAVNCDQCVTGEPNICQSCSAGFFMGNSGQCTEQDNDLDGFTTENDCDDDNASVYPGAPEIHDELDNDCNGEIDEGSVDVSGIWTLDHRITTVCESAFAGFPDAELSISEISLIQRGDSFLIEVPLIIELGGFPPSTISETLNGFGFLYPRFETLGGVITITGIFSDGFNAHGTIDTSEISVSTPVGTYTCQPLSDSFDGKR